LFGRFVQFAMVRVSTIAPGRLSAATSTAVQAGKGSDRVCCMDQNWGGLAPYPITSDDALIHRTTETSHAVERF